MKVIKLCKGHKVGYGFMVAFRMLPKAKIEEVSKDKCEVCLGFKGGKNEMSQS